MDRLSPSAITFRGLDPSLPDPSDWGGGMARLYNGPVKPRSVPTTAPDHYISGFIALNLCEEGEDTGDWHPRTTFFVPLCKNDIPLPRVGHGEAVDTTPMLGTLGVRDMRSALEECTGCAFRAPVWMANHYRAIADLVYQDQISIMALTKKFENTGNHPRMAAVSEINAWLHTSEEIDHLVTHYLLPLCAAMTDDSYTLFETWLPSVVYQD